MTTRQQAVAKALIAGALALGFGVYSAAPAGADELDPNPFSKLKCSCHNTIPPDSPALLAEIHRGMREGFAAQVPGLPPPK